MYIKIGDCGWSIGDTGLGNRIQLWSVHELNKYNNFRHYNCRKKRCGKKSNTSIFHTLLTLMKNFMVLQNLDVIDSRKDWLIELDDKDYFLKSSFID